jgi:hypothetical protein
MLHLGSFNIEFLLQWYNYACRMYKKNNTTRKEHVILIDQGFFTSKSNTKDVGLARIMMNGKCASLGFTVIDEPKQFPLHQLPPLFKYYIDYLVYSSAQNTSGSLFDYLQLYFFYSSVMMSLASIPGKYMVHYQYFVNNKQYQGTIDIHDYHKPFYLTVFYNTMSKKMRYKYNADLTICCVE